MPQASSARVDAQRAGGEAVVVVVAMLTLTRTTEKFIVLP